MKPATFTREMFFKGVLQYLKDWKVRSPKRDEEIYEEVPRLVESDAELARMKQVAEPRAGLMSGDAKGKG